MSEATQPDPASVGEPGIPAHKLLALYDRVLAPFDRLASAIVIVAMAVLSFVLCLAVFYRYGLNRSLLWGWDVPRMAFIWVVLIAIPLGFKYSVHVGIDLVIDYLRPQHRRLIFRINAILIAAFLAPVAWYAMVLARETWDQMQPGIDVSVGWFYLALVWGAVHSILHLLRLAWTGTPSAARLDLG